MIRISDIFTRLGGVAVVRDITGENYQTCNSWKTRNGYIPQHHHLDIVAYAKKRGIDVTLQLLVEAAANERCLKNACKPSGKAVA
jgi:hypothetical protein